MFDVVLGATFWGHFAQVNLLIQDLHLEENTNQNAAH